ncbi:Deoxyribose-phosphate aldolase [Desulfovibrio sp. X2]|uniref:deoxyribose-phosphate aldolase n=1 Tax=Desulfovibrio sp. X2 TaxID=941449 RepID=UPI000358C521|nr:deoxyribose-phosphate aldolase [Desulfovibrio sp. X2]EPR37549.1 Deoxyribose-phosphate aldolase [Desulfovibrio sp. X2]
MDQKDLTPRALAARIDHTLLDLSASPAAIEKLCREALEHGFKAVCVYPVHVARAAKLLAGSPVLVAAVVGFPTGLEPTSEKVSQALAAVGAGARELDMVVNLAALRGRDHAAVARDIGAVVAAAAPFAVKVILETAALSRDEKIIGAALAKAAGAAFVKTSTGFGPGGATVGDVELLRAVVGPDVSVKASGGIRTFEDARAMLEAGADRLGCSSSLAILSGAAS